FLCNDYRLSIEFSYRFKEVFDVLRHSFSCDCLPSLLDKYHFSDALKLAHLGNENFHNDYCDDREKDWVILDVVKFEDNEAFFEKVKVRGGVEQIIKFSTFIVRPKHVKEIFHIKVLLLDFVFPKSGDKYITEEFIERVEAREQCFFLFEMFIVHL